MQGVGRASLDHGKRRQAAAPSASLRTEKHSHSIYLGVGALLVGRLALDAQIFLFEEREIDGGGHGFVAGVVGVQVVADVE
jgi:hypothetical protein